MKLTLKLHKNSSLKI